MDVLVAILGVVSLLGIIGITGYVFASESCQERDH
jgi:hypothetical protein